MPLDDLPLHASDRRLLAVLADVIDLELSTPDPVLQAAKSLHDWSRVDAELAETTVRWNGRHATCGSGWRSNRTPTGGVG
jgi:hypothetical protein